MHFYAISLGGEPHPDRDDLKYLVLAPGCDTQMPEVVRAEVHKKCPLIKAKKEEKIPCIASEWLGEDMYLVDDLKCATCRFAGHVLGTCPHPDASRSIS